MHKCNINTLVIGSKEHFKIIQPYLSEFFNGQKYLFWDENEVVYNIGKWKSQKILKFCSNKNIEHILFATTNKKTQFVTNKFYNFHGIVHYIPIYTYPEITSLEMLKKVIIPCDMNKPCLSYFEYHVDDHCNLNCKGCAHYSNIEPKPYFADFNQYISDLKKLRELFWGISQIRLLGGEPLLNPILWKFIDVTRELFPETDLRIVSNGLLLPRISDELIEHIRKAKAGFDITNYPPTYKMRDKICQKLDSEKIYYNYDTSSNPNFYKRLTKKPINNDIVSFKYCESKSCNFLGNGTLSVCPMSALIHKYNAHFGTNYPSHETNILSEINDGWDLCHNLQRPIRLCKYCSPVVETYNWEVCSRANAKPEDWIVDENKMVKLKYHHILIAYHPYIEWIFEKWIRRYYNKLRNIRYHKRESS